MAYGPTVVPKDVECDNEAILDALASGAFYNERGSVDVMNRNNPSPSKSARASHVGGRIMLKAPSRLTKLFLFVVNPKSSKAAQLYSYFIGTAALASCFMLVLETLDGPNHGMVHPEYPNLPTKETYYLSESIFTIIFTLELLGRMAIWPSLWRENDILVSRGLRPFWKDWFNWFDLLAILPYYLDFLFGHYIYLDTVRLARLLRIFKLARNHSSTYVLLEAIRNSLAPISVALIFFMEIVFFFSVVMYVVDPNLDRSQAGFSDLLSSSYFVVITVATIGYGDITPTHGNAIAHICAILAIMMGTFFMSMPFAIIGTEFDRAWKDHMKKEQHLLRLQNQQMGLMSIHDATPTHRDSLTNESTQIVNKNEVLVKYNAPNRLYLRLAGMTGEASLMTQALAAEAAGEEVSLSKLRDIAEDAHHQLTLCVEHCRELGLMIKDMIIPTAQKQKETVSWRKWLHTTLSDPQSSRLAWWISRWIKFTWVGSMILIGVQTLPEIHTYGEETALCESVVEIYCTSVSQLTPETDPGCYQTDSLQHLLRFDCSSAEKEVDPSCYGFGRNYGGRQSDGLMCNSYGEMKRQLRSHLNSTNRDNLSLMLPFRPDYQLPSFERVLGVCKRWQCNNKHITYLDFGIGHDVMEYLLFFAFMFELAASLFVTNDWRGYFRNPLVFIEMASFLPFLVYEFQRIFYGITPRYIIPPGSTDTLTCLRLFRVFRIFKIQQNIPVTHVISDTIIKTSSRLAIPYLMLILVSTMLSFAIYEVEKGYECFYGTECIVLNKNVTFPASLDGAKIGKRFLVNFKGEISPFSDFFASFWFILVTLATVGYGDMEPSSTTGKMIAVIAMIFGACYTAMPLTLVGSQFNRSYRDYKRREAMLRTKAEVSKPFEVMSSEYLLWQSFAKNEAFELVEKKVHGELIPLLKQMTETDIVSGSERFIRVQKLTAELKDAMFQQSLDVMQVSTIVNKLRQEGIRLAKQQTRALQNIL